MASWGDTKDRVAQLGDPAMILCAEVLDCWADDYVRDEDWLMGPDERNNMMADISTFRNRLAQVAFGSGFSGSGGGDF